ncbi:hypothetical protein SALBM217S_02883 [Streptomyces griseoloalbus]
MMDDPDTAHRVTDEVADVLAYLLQFCEVLGIDPLAALAAKIDRNEYRFPVPELGPNTPPAPRSHPCRSHAPWSKSRLVAKVCPQISDFLWPFVSPSFTLGSEQGSSTDADAWAARRTDGGSAWTLCGSS